MFDRNVQEETLELLDGARWFAVDPATGTITVLRDGAELAVECWWRGRAPWDTLNLELAKGLKYSGSGDTHTTGPLPCEWNRREVRPGHFILDGIVANKGDQFNMLHLPAHMQGSPAVFQLSIECGASPTPHPPSASEPPEPPPHPPKRSDKPPPVDEAPPPPVEALTEAATANGSFTGYQPVSRDGTLPIDLVDSSAAADTVAMAHTSSATALAGGVPSTLSPAVTAAKDLLCLYGSRHRRLQPSDAAQDKVCWPVCFACKAPFSVEAVAEEVWFKERILAQDHAMFGGSSEAAATASHARGVTVQWLVSFADTFGYVELGRARQRENERHRARTHPHRDPHRDPHHNPRLHFIPNMN